MDFFFDNQIRRYLLQFMRVFSDVKYREGPDSNGLYTIKRVPIMYGDPSWMVAQIIKGASENTMLPSPMFSVWIDDIKKSAERRQDTQYVGKVSTIERQFDARTQTYGPGPGVRQDIERYMPVPYDIFFKLDVWVPNISIKLQIFEQLAPIFNPSIQLQQNSNLLDWTSIFELWEEEMTWTNRSIPQGTNDDRDVLSYKFKIQGLINPPAKLKRSSLIAEIVTRVYQSSEVDELAKSIDRGEEYDPFSCIDNIPLQIVTTEGNYKISVSKGTNSDIITLLNEYGETNTNLSWQSLIEKYGQITPNITKIRLKLDPNLDVDSSDIIGGIEQDPVNKNILFFTPDIDTFPPTTLPPVTSIIDPMEVWPGNGLPVAVGGQRYLLTSADSKGEEPAIPPNVDTSPWGNSLIAYPNDIIEFNGINWVVVFSAKNSIGKNYVVNNSNASHYTFDSLTQEWTYTYYGVYQPGAWRIDNIIQAPNGTTINNFE